MSVNIVELIECNPITKLSQIYNGVLISKIQEEFGDFEQQLFVSSFYCYLKYDNYEFVIDLDNIWQWIGFSSKQNAIRVLEKNFKLDVDYKYTEQLIPTENRGGQNRQMIFLNIETFKLFCLKSQTAKSSQIHKYYIKMERLLHEAVEEESDELKKQLEQKDIQLELKDKQSQHTARKAAEQATIAQFPRNTQCVYIGTTGNVSKAGESLIKFGQTNDLLQRVYNHRGTFDNFILITAFRVPNSTEIENLIRGHQKIKKQIRDVELGGKNYKEMIAYDESEFTVDKIIRYIKSIIDSKQYSVENFNALMKQNDELSKQNEELTEEIKELRLTNLKQHLEIERFTTTVGNQSIVISAISEETIAPDNTHQNRFDEFITNSCILRPDVEESCTNLEGQFRIYCQTKPSKEIFHAFKEYLDTKFRPHRLMKQDKNGVVMGYIGVKLNPIEYVKTAGTDVEDFLFQICRFSPSGKVLNSKLADEYKRWKTRLGKPTGDESEGIREIKAYLNASPYALKSVVWVSGESNEGYYGLSLRSEDETQSKTTLSTGKKVEKRETSTHRILDTWQTIAKAAISEKISAAKLSRSIKNNVVFGDYYYATI